MLIDDFKEFLEIPSDGKDALFWYGPEFRFPEEDFSSSKRSYELAKHIFADKLKDHTLGTSARADWN